MVLLGSGGTLSWGTNDDEGNALAPKGARLVTLSSFLGSAGCAPCCLFFLPMVGDKELLFAIVKYRCNKVPREDDPGEYPDVCNPWH